MILGKIKLPFGKLRASSLAHLPTTCPFCLAPTAGFAPPRPPSGCVPARPRPACNMLTFWIRHIHAKHYRVFKQWHSRTSKVCNINSHTILLFLSLLACRGVNKQAYASVHWRAARQEEPLLSFGHIADNLLRNCLSTARCVPPSIYIKRIACEAENLFQTFDNSLCGGEQVCVFGHPMEMPGAKGSNMEAPAIGPCTALPFGINRGSVESTVLGVAANTRPPTFLKSGTKFPNMLCMKRVYKDKKASVHWSTTRNDERPSSRGQTGYKLRIKRLSTTIFVPPSVSIGFPLFVLPETCPGGCFSIVCKVRVTVVFWANGPVCIRPCPSPPRPAVLPCAAPSRPARGMSGFKTRQVIIQNGRSGAVCLGMTLLFRTPGWYTTDLDVATKTGLHESLIRTGLNKQSLFGKISIPIVIGRNMENSTCFRYTRTFDNIAC